jgi:glutaredoxin
MPGPRITLLSRPGCHLCDDAREIIRRVADDLGVAWTERDITQSEDDQREYWEKIPVTFVDGIQHDFWRVSEDRLRAALARDSAVQRLARLRLTRERTLHTREVTWRNSSGRTVSE